MKFKIKIVAFGNGTSKVVSEVVDVDSTHTALFMGARIVTAHNSESKDKGLGLTYALQGVFESTNVNDSLGNEIFDNDMVRIFGKFGLVSKIVLRKEDGFVLDGLALSETLSQYHCVTEGGMANEG